MRHLLSLHSVSHAAPGHRVPVFHVKAHQRQLYATSDLQVHGVGVRMTLERGCSNAESTLLEASIACKTEKVFNAHKQVLAVNV